MLVFVAVGPDAGSQGRRSGLVVPGLPVLNAFWNMRDLWEHILAAVAAAATAGGRGEGRGGEGLAVEFSRCLCEEDIAKETKSL